jgi:hypothetical protein
MWERLRLKYEKESLSSQSKLRKEFHNLKKGEKSLENYIKEFDALCDKMRGVGLEITNNEKVLQLTEGLSEMEYDVIVTNILDIDGVEYEEACAKLLIYEARHARGEGDSRDGESFLSQRGGRGRFHSGGNATTASYRDILLRTAQNRQSATSAKSLGTRPMTVLRRRRDLRNHKAIRERRERATAWKPWKTAMWSKWRKRIEVR